MILEKKLKFKYDGKNIILRTLYPKDVTISYINGLRKQNKFLVNNPQNISIEWQKNYIDNILQSEENSILGLFINGNLIGTSGLQNLRSDKDTTIGIFIFDKSFRGIGLGKTLVWSSCYLTYKCKNIVNFSAGMKKNNIPSLKSFTSCGFKIIDKNKKNYLVKLNIEKLKKPSSI